MASKNANTSRRRFEGGGVITIGNGTDVFTVQNIVPGSTRRVLPMETPLEGVDRDTQVQPYRGPDQLGEFELTIFGGQDTTDQLMSVLMAVPASSNQVKEFTVTVKIPDYRGASTGESFVTANAYLAGRPERQGGAEFDTCKFSMKFRTYTISTY